MDGGRKCGREIGQDQQHLGITGRGSDKEFVFYPKSNRNALEDSGVGSDLFLKELFGCFIGKRAGQGEERRTEFPGGYCSRVGEGDGD